MVVHGDIDEVGSLADFIVDDTCLDIGDHDGSPEKKKGGQKVCQRNIKETFYILNFAPRIWMNLMRMNLVTQRTKKKLFLSKACIALCFNLLHS